MEWLLLILVLFIFFLLYYKTTQKCDYWKKRKVPYLPPATLLGNYGEFILLKSFIGKVTKKICEQFPQEPCVGAFYGTEPTLLVQDPNLLKLILSKDFYYFNGREVSKYAGKEPTTKGIFFISGDSWKVIRQNLTPLFSTAKMKNMFPLIEKCTHDLVKMLDYETSVSNVIDANMLMSRFTIDCVGSCGFGIEMNLMQNDYNSKNNPYRRLANLIFGQSDYRGYKLITRSIWPKIFYALGFQTFPRELKDTLIQLVTNVFDLRQNKPSSRNDFVDLILTLKQHEYLVGECMSSMKTGESKTVSVKVDNELLSGQCAVFFGGAFETSATTLTLILFELSKNQEAQIRAMKEVDEYLLKHDNKVEYNCVTELPFLSACMSETLRLHPVFTVITREVMEGYTLPTGLHLDKGVRIHIPVYHIHRNPENFPEPEKFRPERFLPEGNFEIKPFTYLPFGEGPRYCIGFRFGKMQIMAGLVTVLKRYSVHLADGMSPTVEFDPRWIVSHTVGKVNLKFERRNDLK